MRALGGLAVPELFQSSAQLVARLLDTEFVKVLALEADGRTARVVAGVGWHAGVVGHATVTVGRDSQAGYALLSHAPVLVDDLNAETRFDDLPMLREHGVVSGISVILYGPGGAAYGVLGAHTARRRRFSQDDVDFLQGVANVLSAALHRQHTEDELRHARTEAEAYAAQLQEQAAELEQQTEEAQALAEELEQANQQLLDATADAERARDASAFLAEASRAFSASLDYPATLRAVADSAVPRLGDWCAIDLVRDPARPAWPPDLERLTVVHQDPEKLALSVELNTRYPTDWSAPAGLPAVLRDRTPMFLPTITDAMAVAAAHDAGHLEILRQLQFSSLICVPLVARDVTLGALTLVMTESGRHYDAADFALAQDLAHRAAVAVDNARLYRDAEAARAQAEEANRSKSQFLATMSHELRTPLNAIAGYVQLLILGLHGPLTDAQRHALERVDRAQHHLLGLINDVLNYARLESGRVEYDLRPVRVSDVVRDVWAMVEPQFTTKGLAFDARLPEDQGRPPLPVWADREKLTQILLNLLSNAVKFTPAVHDTPSGSEPGRVTVQLSERDPDVETDQSAERVYLRVIDTGVGIPPEKLDRIFEPFVQVRSELTRETGGTGLGLAISRDLAHGMGGELRVRSVEGGGSTFTLVLRRVVSPAGSAVEGPSHT